jgi:sigma-E factor negative regulatory protein RseA
MTSDISALMDGELDPDEAGRLLGTLKQDARLRDTWAAYHLIGDALRNSGPLATDVSAGFAQRLSAEPTLLAPRKKTESPRRFPALALAASISAFGFVGVLAWQVVKLGSVPTGGTLVASASAPTAERAKAAPPLQLASAQPTPAPADAAPVKEPPRLKFSVAAGDSYLLAHQEFSPSYAVAGLSAYARTVPDAEQDTGQ